MSNFKASGVANPDTTPDTNTNPGNNTSGRKKALMALAFGLIVLLLIGILIHFVSGAHSDHSGHANHTGTSDGAKSDVFIWQQSSEQGLFEVTLDAKSADSIILNEFLEWELTITTTDGEPVTPARISVSGGMPAHGHGLPSQPQVGEHQGDGKYLVKGVNFSMNGDWEMAFDIQSEDKQDKVKFDLLIDY